jgi:peptidoglycan/LPS O-acetylase OafA/YrhL
MAPPASVCHNVGADPSHSRSTPSPVGLRSREPTDLKTGQRTVSTFRPDLEGLRGVAILLVLLCHVRIPGAEAGFVGVDVFFVLSGFLITGLLVEQLDRTGRIDLHAFYARRVRRIVPAALVVLVATLAAAQLVLSPLDLPRVTDDVMTAGLSVANVHFALGATDYFAPVDPSPVLHYWSLGVEEQFYLLWPIVLIAAARLGRPRLAMAVAVAVVCVASFALSAAVTTPSPAWAYYSLPTRAWQLAAGALVALARPAIGRLPRPVGAFVGWVGVGLLAAALVTIGPTTEYPGLAALLPTLAAVALIASGGRGGSPGWLALTRAPLRFLGRISYSLYLWHWPILVLGSMALAPGADAGPINDDGTLPDLLPLRIGLALLAVGVAWLSWRFVEEPFRRGRRWQFGQLRGFGLASAAVAAVLVASATMGAVANGTVRAADLTEADPAIAVVDPSAASDIASVPARWRGRTASAAVPSPSAARSTAPSPPPAVVAASWLNQGSVPANLTPSLSAARTDGDSLMADGCGLSLAGSVPPDCVYGNPKGALTVALVGDSHAAHWFPAMEVIARKHGWRLVPLTKFSCVFVDMRIYSPLLEREYTECEAWRENVIDRLAALKPDLVVIASNRYLPVVDDRDSDAIRQGAAGARLVERIDAPVALIADTPRSNVDVPACLAQHRDSIENCTTSRADAFTWRHLRREKETVRLTDAKLVDLSSAVCPADPCPPIVGSMLVYRDNHHLTATFARSLAGVLDSALPPIVPATAAR